MRNLKKLTVSGLVLLTIAGVAMADDDDHDAYGHIDAVNQQAHTIVVDHTTYRLTHSTEYDDLGGFDDLRVGQSVEIEFHEDNGQRYVEEIDRGDD